MPMTSPPASGAGIFGPYADTTALQAAKPAAANPGSMAYVGASAPYAQYVSSGSAWVVSGGATPAGSDTHVQFNDGGALGADADLRWDKTANTLYLVNNYISGASNGALLTVAGSAGSTVQIAPRAAPAWGAGFGYVEPGMTLAANASLAWTDSTSSPLAGTSDLRLYRVGAGIVGQHNGANAQQHQWYGTRTDASNYRRVSAGMSTAGVGYLRPEGAGTGASGNVLHISGLPTSNPGPGILWNDAGTVKVGT